MLPALHGGGQAAAAGGSPYLASGPVAFLVLSTNVYFSPKMIFFTYPVVSSRPN